MYYSASTNGFYLPEINGPDMPSDAVEIAPERYRDLMEGQASGKVLTSEKGLPVLKNPVPGTNSAVITMRQCRLQLLAIGKLTAVENAMASASESARIEWEYAATVHRDNPVTISVIASLGADAQAADEFFHAASLL